MCKACRKLKNYDWEGAWEQFESDFLYYWRQSKYPAPEILIDWKLARSHWKRYHCTAGEHVRLQIGILLNDRSCVNIHNRPNNDNDDKGGDWLAPISPKPLMPALA
jgi:hypothetical protein